MGGDDSVGREPSFHTQTNARQTDTINTFFALNQEEIRFGSFISLSFCSFCISSKTTITNLQLQCSMKEKSCQISQPK